MFQDFDFSVLTDPEYKEDAVREDLIKPLLAKLGYTPSGENKMVRSRGIEHPFVYIGSKKKPISIIPDYILEVGDKHKWVLDAKKPSENILKGKNVEQAYSYAMHPDIRATIYVLCNGNELSVFDVTRKDPIALFSLSDINSKWDDLYKLLSPIAFSKPHLLNFKPDLGLYMYKSGMLFGQKLTFEPMGIPFIVKVNDGLYSMTVNIDYNNDGKYFTSTFDFGKKQYKQLLSSISKHDSAIIRNALRQYPYKATFEENIPTVSIGSVLGDNILSNGDEDYCPFTVKKFKQHIKMS